MTTRTQIANRWWRGLWALVIIAVFCSLANAQDQNGDAQKLTDLLNRTADQTSAFLDHLADVECTEHVVQEKMGKDDKVELKEESAYDYLVILTNSGGELNLTESRSPLHQAKPDRKNTSMLLSNGFATLFLVFHPYYSDAFKFSFAGEEVIGGRTLDKVTFQHVSGMKSPAALALRGREYPLELSGTAWIVPQTGTIAKIEAGIESTLEDVGLKSLHAEVVFAPLPLGDSKLVYWFPDRASVEVETSRQHWRNLHQFGEYKRFSVATEEKVSIR